MAGLLTTLASLPALATAPGHPYPLSLAASLFFFCVFLLWAFVFAWHFQYTARPVFLPPFQPKLWLSATVYGLLVGLLVWQFLDPSLRQIVPAEYPANTGSWMATSLFQICFGPLYVCFAPFAFFMRLTRRPPVATALTVAWGLFVEYLVLGNHPTLPPVTLTAIIMLRSVISGFVAVYFYLNGGVLLIWWVGLLLQLRLLLELPK